MEKHEALQLVIQKFGVQLAQENQSALSKLVDMQSEEELHIGAYPVSRLMLEDILDTIEREGGKYSPKYEWAKKLTEEQVAEIADKMHDNDAYMEQWWMSLDCTIDYFFENTP